MASADEAQKSRVFSAGLHRLGYWGLNWPWLVGLLVVAVSLVAGFGVNQIRVDDSLSELFRTNTEEFKRYEDIDRRFPSSEYDVLVVVEGKNLLERSQLEAFAHVTTELQLADGVAAFERVVMPQYRRIRRGSRLAEWVCRLRAYPQDETQLLSEAGIRLPRR